MSKTIIPVAVFDDIAEEIKRIDKAMRAINTSKLTQEAIVTLLSRSTKETKSSINRVLWGLSNIGKFLK